MRYSLYCDCCSTGGLGEYESVGQALSQMVFQLEVNPGSVHAAYTTLRIFDNNKKHNKNIYTGFGYTAGGGSDVMQFKYMKLDVNNFREINVRDFVNLQLNRVSREDIAKLVERMLKRPIPDDF